MKINIMQKDGFTVKRIMLQVITMCILLMLTVSCSKRDKTKIIEYNNEITPGNELVHGNEPEPDNESAPGNEIVPGNEPAPGNESEPGNELVPEDDPAPGNELLPEHGLVPENDIPDMSEETIADGVQLEGMNIGGLTEDEVREIILQHSSKIDKEPRNASYDKKTWEILPEQNGLRVNVEKTMEKVLSAAENENVKLVVDQIKPAVTAGMIAEDFVVIGDYTTPLLNRKKSRINNIKIASKKIDGYKLEPGERFSFNKVLGRRTRSKGYQKAPVIIRTKEGPKLSLGVGGGICQLSSTIYNAARQCKLEIIERHVHSKDVGYVPKGKDATVVYGGADLKLRNNRPNTIMIRIFLSSKSLRVKIIEKRI